LRHRPDAGRPLDDSKAMLVSSSSNGDIYLIWKSRRYWIRDRDVVLSALFWSAQPRMVVATAMLNSLPSGADLAHIPLPGVLGQAAYGHKVGQVFQIDNEAGARTYAVALPTGLAEINQVQADLIIGDPEVQAAVKQKEPITMRHGQYTAEPKAKDS